MLGDLFASQITTTHCEKESENDRLLLHDYHTFKLNYDLLLLYSSNIVKQVFYGFMWYHLLQTNKLKMDMRDQHYVIFLQYWVTVAGLNFN